MSKLLQWIVGVGVIVIVAAVVVSTFWPLFAAGPGWVGTGMMGSGHMMGGGGMMGGWGMPFFGLGMMLWPLLIVGLVVLGAVWLERNLRPPVTPPAPTASISQACPHCGNPVQSGWKACPYCGEKI